MNTISRKRTVTVEEPVYVAFDGTEFSNEDECYFYEESSKEFQSFYALRKVETTGEEFRETVGEFYSDDNVIGVYIDSEETLEIVNRYLEVRSGMINEFNETHIGKVVLICFQNDEPWYFGDAEAYKKAVCDYIDNEFIKPLTENHD